MSVSAIILAAGASARMGRTKQLLPVSGRPMLAAVLHNYHAAAALNRVLVVVNPNSRSVARPLTEYPVHLIPNPSPHLGMFSSVQAGLRALGGQDDALIGLCDQPSLSPHTIAHIVRAACETGKGIIIPTHGGRGGHPIFIARRFFAEIGGMNPTLTLKHFVTAHIRNVFRLEVADRGVIQDIDDMATYQRELSKRV